MKAKALVTGLLFLFVGVSVGIVIAREFGGTLEPPAPPTTR